MKFELSKPAGLAAIAYLIMGLVILLPLNIGGKDPIYGEELGKGYNLTRRILIVLVMLIPIGLSIYSINCMMVGKCVIWSWVNALIIAVWVLLFLIAALMSYDNRSKVEGYDVEGFGFWRSTGRAAAMRNNAYAVQRP